MVYLASQSVKIPVMGIGGITNARDAIETIMYGASAVGVVTAPILKGFGVITEIRDGIAAFMARHGYQSIEEFRGIAKKHVVADMYTEIDLPTCAPSVDSQLCDGCGICTLPGHCDAISIEGSIAVCNEERCEGCGLCAQLCPQEAMTMSEL